MSESTPQIIVPPLFGRAAVDSLNLVPWEHLRHCYGYGKVSDELSGSVEATLRAFASDDPETMKAGAHDIGSNVCHQSTIYEATAYAVPFIAAIAAGEERATFRLVAALGFLAEIANACTYEAGTDDDAVGPATHAAFGLSDPALVAIRDRIPSSQPFIAALRAFAMKKTVRRGDASRALKLAEKIAIE
jgi:hypothetical protein